MVLSKIIQRIQSLYSKGVESDDTRLSKRHIYNKILTVRNILLQQKANKNQYISPFNNSVLNCVELEKLPLHECPCIPAKGCCMWRTKYEIPKIISSKSKMLINSVTSLDGRIIFGEVDWNNFRYQKANRYTATKPNYFITNNYLYVTAKNKLEVIRIEALLEDPLDELTYPGLCEKDCFDIFEFDFPIESSMIDPLVQMTAEELIRVFNTNIEDSTNNTRDNLESQTK